MARRHNIAAERVQLPEYINGVWSGKWLPPTSIDSLPQSMTLDQLRNSSRYWTVSDAKLKRDLRGRTIEDIYRENRAGREVTGGFTPNDGIAVERQYVAWCKARKHTPHPASIDPQHPIAKQREGLRFVKREG